MKSEKYLLIFFVALFMIIGFIEYIDFKEDQIAMKNGYTQIIKNNKVIWVKLKYKNLHKKENK